MDPKALSLVSGVIGLLGLSFARMLRTASSAQTELGRAWVKFARRRGYELVPAGPRLEERWPLIRADVGPSARGGAGVAVRIDVHEVATGHGAAPFTRVSAEAHAPVDVVVRVDTRAVGQQRWALTPIATMDATFEERFLASSSDPAIGGRLVDDEIRSLMLAVPTRARPLGLSYVRGSIELAWSGEERDAAVLDAAVEVVAALARFRPHTRGYR